MGPGDGSEVREIRKAFRPLWNHPRSGPFSLSSLALPEARGPAGPERSGGAATARGPLRPATARASGGGRQGALEGVAMASARRPAGPEARHSPGLGPHAEQVAAAGRAGDPHRPVVLAVAPRPGPPARAPAAPRDPARPHPAAGPARSPGPCPAGRRSRPRLTRAPIYSPAARPSSPAAVPPPAPAGERGLRGAGGRRASPERPTLLRSSIPGPRPAAPAAAPAWGPGPREASRCAPNSRPQDADFLPTVLPRSRGRVATVEAGAPRPSRRGRCRSTRSW